MADQDVDKQGAFPRPIGSGRDKSARRVCGQSPPMPAKRNSAVVSIMAWLLLAICHSCLAAENAGIHRRLRGDSLPGPRFPRVPVEEIREANSGHRFQSRCIFPARTTKERHNPLCATVGTICHDKVSIAVGN
jgi:hypothetical protein